MSDSSDQEFCCPVLKTSVFKLHDIMRSKALAKDVSLSDVGTDSRTTSKGTNSPIKRKPSNGDLESEDSLISIYSDKSQELRYAITVNICPNKLMNKRKWRLYSQDDQRRILSRVEKSLRVKTPSIKLIKINYEVCPTLKQVHFHALYEMPTEYMNELETYYQRVVGMPEINGDKNKQWRHLVTKPIFSEEGWIEYITKDE